MPVSSRRKRGPDRLSSFYRPALELLEIRAVPAAVVAVNAAANVHAIDPLIYGSSFATTAQLQGLNLTLNRDGGNASDTYSYQYDATNHASDYYYESIPWGNGTPGNGADTFIADTKAGGAQPTITINPFNWAAKTGPGNSLTWSFSTTEYPGQDTGTDPVTGQPLTDPYQPTAGSGILGFNGNQPIYLTGNNPTDAYVPNSPAIESTWIQHLISTFGTSQNGGVQYYTIGNEPGLWNSTHRDIHPNGETVTELINDITSYASMIKSLDPNAQILGPEEWGWTNYFVDGADSAAGNYSATYGPQHLNAEEYLLQQLQAHDATTGQRSLDYFTLHYYPQGDQNGDQEFSNDVSQATELLRNESTRSLWDPTYQDQSWIGGTGINGGIVDLIPTMQNWVNTYYPGTKTGITEYNWGADGNMNGATTQADIWGIFGKEGLDMANRWGTPDVGTPTYLAMQMYRNYDGHDSTFGDESVSATVGNPDQLDAFSAVRSSDGALTVMVINKNLYSAASPNTSVTVNLSNFVNNGVAQEWHLAAINPNDQTNAAISQLANVNFGSNSFTLSVPDESVTLFVIEPGGLNTPSTPTHLTATSGQNQVSFVWTSVFGATSYNLYRSTVGGGEGSTPYKTGLTATNFVDPGLVAGRTYYYTVTAVNADGQSAQSTDSSAYTGTTFFSNFTSSASSLTNPPWNTVLGGGFSVNSSNQAVSSAIVNGLYKAATVDNVSLANVSVQADVALSASPAQGTSAAAVIARSQDANDVNNCYFAAITPAPGGLDQLLIEKVIGGQITGIAAKALAAGTTSGTLTLEVFGNTLTAYLNGQLEVTTTDSTYATAGNVGIGAQDQGATFANVAVASLAAPPMSFSDNFTRPASISLGGPWYVNAALPINSTTGPGGGFGINGSNQAISLTGGLNVASLFGVNLTSSVNVSATVVNAGAGAGVVADWNSATRSGYMLLLSGSSLQLYKVNNGSATMLGTAHPVSSNSGTVDLQVSGGTVSALFNSAPIFSTPDSTFSTGSAGLAANGAGAAFSAFNVGGS